MEAAGEDKQRSTDVAVTVEPIAVSLPSKSVVARFLEVRGIERKKPTAEQPKMSPAAALASSTKARIPVRAMWSGYSRRRCGAHADFQRRAMRTPDESFSESVDVYNPKRRPRRFIKVHEEANSIGDEFLYQTRRLFFEREVVDHPVCELLENRDEFDARLDHIYDEGDKDESEVDGKSSAPA